MWLLVFVPSTAREGEDGRHGGNSKKGFFSKILTFLQVEARKCKGTIGRW